MEKVSIDGKQYTFVQDVKNDRALRDAFNRLTMEVYGFDFEFWYQSGYWGDNYQPCALFDGDDMVSNISTSVIEFMDGMEKRKYVQIGTVMTAPGHRHQRLNRFLMDKVLAAWRGNCDLIYLFANDSVLDFYPKFGFTAAQEYQYSKSVSGNNVVSPLTKLDMAEGKNQALVFSYVEKARAISSLAMLNNASLIMFWLMSFYSDRVYYSSKFDAIVIMQEINGEMLLLDVFSEHHFNIDDLISALLSKTTQRVMLGFTPPDKSSFEENRLVPDDVLFVLDDKQGLAANKRFMFPLLSHA